MKKETIMLLLISFLFLNGSNAFAQEQSFKIVSNGQVVYSSITNDIDYVTMDVGLPTPVNLACSVNEGNISIRWSAVLGATSYNVYRSTDNSVYTKIGTSSSVSYIDSSPAVGINYYKIQATASNIQSILSKSSYINAPTTRPNGYEYVDLGLPSGLKWATMNVGASTPEEYGNYYAWGEVETKSNYSSTTSSTYNQDIAWLTNNGYLDSEGNLKSDHDAAAAYCGGSWRMPTLTDFMELEENCTWEAMLSNNVKVFKVTGKNGNFIYIPLAGRCSGTAGVSYAGEWLEYWGSTPTSDNKCTACRLSLRSYGTVTGVITLNPTHRISSVRPPVSTQPATSRYHGLPIRPVIE